MESMKRLSIVLALLLVVGCQEPPNVSGTTPEGLGKIPGSDRKTGHKSHYHLLVMLQMASFEVPLGAASASEQIWSYLDEESVDIERGVSLGRNGFRVGVGRKEDFPDLGRMLKQMTGQRYRESTATILTGRPVQIELKKMQTRQTVFTIYEDGTVTGMDYPAGGNLLTITCTLNEDDPSVIRITAVPQIRSAARKPRVVDNGGVLMIANRPTVYSFHPLTFQVSIPSGDFLVIGPNSASRRKWSPGRAFLLREKEGIPFETVQVLTPEVYAVPARIIQTPEL